MMEHFIDFSPHKICWMLRSDLIWTHAIGGLMTAFAYYLIPVLLITIARKYRFDIRLKFIFGVYALFIFLCGTTHLLDVLMIWQINGFLITFDGWLRVLTGIVSVFSAGVTLYAAAVFLSLFAEITQIAKKMRRERREFDRITTETWNEFKAAMEGVEELLQRGN